MVARRTLLVLAALGLIAAIGLQRSAGVSGAGGSEGLDFSIGVETLGGSMMAPDSCDSSGSPSNVCNVLAGSEFNLRFYLHSLPSKLANGDYDGVDMVVSYQGVTPTQTVGMTWPDCNGPAYNFANPGVASVGCVVLYGPPSTYAGPMWDVPFVCSGSGSVALVHGEEGTGLVDTETAIFKFTEGEGTSESLTINCLSPQAYPADTDGDGCPDAREEMMNPNVGGGRNFLNPWDYFNPTHDGQNRIDDVLEVGMDYFIDDTDGNPGQPPYTAGYDPETDRTFVGPDAWDLGAPDGLHRVKDIVHSVDQYFHDCP